MTYLLATTLLIAEATGASAPPPVDLAALEACEDSLDVAIFNSPRAPHAQAPLRVLAVSDEDLGAARVLALGPDGVTRELAARATVGPPWGWSAEVEAPAVGRWRLALVTARGVAACQDTRVGRSVRGSNGLDEGGPVWTSRIKWERDTENLFSLWVEHLFDAPVDVDISWNPLHEVLRDPERNLLFDHLGLGEDRSGRGALRLDPDCADFPYYLRAYFAWKLHLPFAFRPCRRGNARRAPTCGDMLTNEQPAEGGSRLAAFQAFMRKVKGTVHSSSMRGLPEDEQSDFYPVALDRRGLRPGTIYTDPYGHTMMIARWFPQADGAAGVLMTADAQPDGQVGRRIFWRGSFMFPEDDAVAGAGWKRFRPVRKIRDGHVALSNAEIAASVDYGDFSLAQWSYGKDGFYEKMDEVINPEPLAPERALIATIDALDQQVRRRVESVDNGEAWKRDHRGKTMPMPDGAGIFLTSGPWEDFSTPSRDMRLLIAMDTVRDLPARVARRPERFVLDEGERPEAARARLERMLEDETSRRTITYRRSDGSPWTLSLADLLARQVGFEVAYNPNDCPEVRWAAPEGSEEAATCDGRAPEAHRAKMARYRAWFEKRERPMQ